MADRKASGRSGKSEWMEESEPTRREPMTRGELDGQDLLGQSSVRDGAIPGVSDTDPERQNSSLSYGTGDGMRRNPPEADRIDGERTDRD